VAFEADLRQLWEERANSRFLYRGMSVKDLTDPLDPARDPFDGMRPGILELLDMLQGLVDTGFEFKLREEHFGHVCWHDLGDIIQWTRHDLDEPGVDFTSHHAAAREYADCFQGSQLKQNLKYITDYLPERRDEPLVMSNVGRRGWDLVSDIKAWVSTESPDHRGVVIHVRRSCPVFETDDRFLPVGGYEYFRERALRAVEEAGMSENVRSVRKLLPDEEQGFDFRLRSPLGLEDIEEVEGVLPDRAGGVPSRKHGKQ